MSGGPGVTARAVHRSTSASYFLNHHFSMFHPVLYPGVGELLRITQQELGYVVGLSRQRVNEALNALQDRGLIRIEYGGVRVLDLEGLRTALFAQD